MKFATKPIQHHPPRLRHVATLPWEIKNSYAFQQCQKLENRLRFDKVTESFKVGTFFETQCI